MKNKIQKENYNSHLVILKKFRESQALTINEPLPRAPSSNFHVPDFSSNRKKTMGGFLSLLLLSSAALTTAEARPARERGNKPDFSDCRPNFNNVGAAAASGALAGAGATRGLGGPAGMAMGAAAGATIGGAGALVTELCGSTNCMEKKMEESKRKNQRN